MVTVVKIRSASGAIDDLFDFRFTRSEPPVSVLGVENKSVEIAKAVECETDNLASELPPDFFCPCTDGAMDDSRPRTAGWHPRCRPSRPPARRSGRCSAKELDTRGCSWALPPVAPSRWPRWFPRREASPHGSKPDFTWKEPTM